MNRLYKDIGLLFLLVFIGCARAPIKTVEEAMRLSEFAPSLEDDLSFVGLDEAIQKNINRLQEYRSVETDIRFGPVLVNKQIYIKALQRLLEKLRQDPTGSEFLNELKINFEFYEVYGQKEWGDVFITSYYEPKIRGSAVRVPPYTQPLYGEPQDLVKIKFNQFAQVFSDLEPLRDVVNEKSRDGVLRGRLDGHEVLPYYSREEIDSKGLLRAQAPILCYLDPIDAFFLQIQGSGVIEVTEAEESAPPSIENSKQKDRKIGQQSKARRQAKIKFKKNEKQANILRVGYAAQNGHPYKAVGQFLFDVIPREEMSAQKIKDHLRSLSNEERQKILNKNPSYVFMKASENSAVTYFGTEAVAGRTIATDSQYFPKGALALLSFEKPKLPINTGGEKGAQQVAESGGQQSVMRDAASSASPDLTNRVTRFVLDQDTGGAIRGPGRVDLFWGRGDEAAQYSGVMRNSGRLYYILPKNKAL